jgi:hypothetical protein
MLTVGRIHITLKKLFAGAKGAGKAVSEMPVPMRQKISKAATVPSLNKFPLRRWEQNASF